MRRANKLPCQVGHPTLSHRLDTQPCRGFLYLGISEFLLQALYRSRLQRIQQAAFKEVIRLLLALPIDGIVAVGKLVQEGICPVLPPLLSIR